MSSSTRWAVVGLLAVAALALLAVQLVVTWPRHWWLAFTAGVCFAIAAELHGWGRSDWRPVFIRGFVVVVWVVAAVVSAVSEALGASASRDTRPYMFAALWLTVIINFIASATVRRNGRSKRLYQAGRGK